MWEPSMAESQLAELQNMRVLLEEAGLLARNLAYHRRAKIEARVGTHRDRAAHRGTASRARLVKALRRAQRDAGSRGKEGCSGDSED